MDTIKDAYKDDEESEYDSSNTCNNGFIGPALPSTATNIDGVATVASTATPDTETEPLADLKDEPLASEDLSDDEISDENERLQNQKVLIEEKDLDGSPKFTKVSEDDFEDDEEDHPPKKQKQLSSLALAELPTEAEQLGDEVVEEGTPVQTTTRITTITAATTTAATVKKSKKKSKNNNVWSKSTSRKGKKKTKNNTSNAQTEDTVLIAPVPRFADKTDDTLDMQICLSKVYKAEKVELSEDRLSAGSSKGYRMVRATRGVMEGSWYFEIKIVKLGETGHTRLGWSTEKGDLQAPVGYDANSFGYRDIDGTKIHKALRDKYAEEGYVEGDVIGCYINLPEGESYAPKPPHMVLYKGQKYVCAPDAKEDPPKVVPGSEISFFKNGICQGVAFQDLFGGRYYPAASMYTLPNQPNCVVKFNFGPDFDFFPEDFSGRPVPKPMIEVPYHGYDYRVENGHPSWVSTRMCPTLKVVQEQ